jgi:hypothetical protein
LQELIAGRQALDHNDFSFLTYISLSVWSFIEYQHSGKKIWIFLIGLFSGMAILCKWLVGHEGSFWFHVEIFDTLYGKVASFLVVPAFYIMYRNARDRQNFCA